MKKPMSLPKNQELAPNHRTSQLSLTPMQLPAEDLSKIILNIPSLL
jgi:hypothetical protein